jgi:hypothetical protein
VTRTSGRAGWGCRVATAIGLGMVAWVAGALAATMFDWNEYAPALLGLAVAVGTGAGPLLSRAARGVIGSKASTVGEVSGDLLLAGISIAAVLLGAWMAGRVEVTCVRDTPDAGARCTIDEYRWLGRVRAAERTVPAVRGARATAGKATAITSVTFLAGRVTPGYAFELDTAGGPVIVTDASRPSAASAVQALAPVLDRSEPGTATVYIVDWLVPAFAATAGIIIALLSLRRARRRLRTGPTGPLRPEPGAL